jgi:hypothetical protein
MTWKDLNWFQFEGSVFIEEFKGPFTTIFTVMQSKFQESRQHRDREIAEKPDNEYIGEELSWSEDRLRPLSNHLHVRLRKVWRVQSREDRGFLG